MAPPLLYGPGGDTLLAVTWTWAAIATILYLLRAFSASQDLSREHRLFPSIRGDFVLVTLGYIAALTAQISTTVSLKYAHQATTNLDFLSTALIGGIVATCAVQFSQSLGRFAVIALLVSLHGTSEAFKKGQKFLYALGFVQFAVNMVQVAMILTQCQPLRRLWNPFITAGNCDRALATRQFGFLSGSTGALADFILAIYPAVFIVGPLQLMRTPMKVAICVIMGGGSVAGIAGVVKTVKLADMEYVQTNYANIVIWILTETWFIIIFGSVTVVRPVFISIGRYIKRTTGRVTSKSKMSGNPSDHNSGTGLNEPQRAPERERRSSRLGGAKGATEAHEDEIALTELGASKQTAASPQPLHRNLDSRDYLRATGREKTSWLSV